MGLSLFLGVIEIACGVLVIARRDHYASRLNPARPGRTRAFLVILGLLLLLVGVFHLAEAFV